MKTSFILIIFSVAFLLQTLAQDSIHFFDLRNVELSKLQQTGKKNNQLVLIYFTSNACGPCHEMEANVFVKPEVVSFYNQNFIGAKCEMIYLNGEPTKEKEFKKLNQKVLKYFQQYKVSSFPTFFFIDYEGKVIHKGYGYQSVTEFIELGKATNDTTRNFVSLKKRIDDGDLSFQTLSKYLFMIDPPDRENGYKNESQVLLDKYFSKISKEDYTSNENWYLIKNFVCNEQKDPLLYFFNHSKLFADQLGEIEVNKCFYLKYYRSTTGARNSKRYKDAHTFFDGLNHPLVIADKKVNKYYYEINDSLKINYINDLDPVFQAYYYIYNRQISDLSKIIYDNNKKNDNVLKAINWMNLVTKQYPLIDYFDILAHLHFLNGDTVLAVQNQQKALELAISNDENADKVDYLKKELEKLN